MPATILHHGRRPSDCWPLKGLFRNRPRSRNPGGSPFDIDRTIVRPQEGSRNRPGNDGRRHRAGFVERLWLPRKTGGSPTGMKHHQGWQAAGSMRSGQPARPQSPGYRLRNHRNASSAGKSEALPRAPRPADFSHRKTRFRVRRQRSLPPKSVIHPCRLDLIHREDPAAQSLHNRLGPVLRPQLRQHPRDVRFHRLLAHSQNIGRFFV